MPEIFPHSITGRPYSSLPTNLWIEMMMNKGSEMKTGWQRILGNENMLCTNIRNTNYINQLRVILYKITEMKVYKSGHMENTATRVRLDELGVQYIDSCITDFACYLFNPANVQLRSLQSGQLVYLPLQMERKRLEYFLMNVCFRELKIGELVDDTEKCSSQ